jgi:hypothetical protein
MNKEHLAQLQALKREKWEQQKPVYNLDGSETFSVEIRANKDVERAMFKPDPFLPGGYIAHPVTIAAMKKDIFQAGDDIDRFKVPWSCEGCQADLDLQFWNFCPYCEKKFPVDVIDRIIEGIKSN